ncbi:tetratricopeptide repeat protein [Thalassiella azotivora]
MSQMPHGPGGSPGINLRGAVDLSGLTRSAGQRAGAASPAAGAAPAATGGATGGTAGGFRTAVVDVTEASFREVVELSLSVPVVVDLWATWCEPCKQLSPVLEKLAREHAGAFLLAKVDVDANPQVSAAFQVQSIPTVVALLKGQPVPLFQGAVPEAQVRQVLDQLLQVAAQNGVDGRLDLAEDTGDADEEPAEEELPPLHQEAYDAIERGDYEAAARAYRTAVAQDPGDDLATAGLAQVELLRRTADVDLDAARARAAGDPSDVDAQLLVADCDVLGGHVEDAFTRLVDLVRVTSGEERERVRVRLVELFEVVGPEDPRVAPARRALASALF